MGHFLSMIIECSTRYGLRFLRFCFWNRLELSFMKKQTWPVLVNPRKGWPFYYYFVNPQLPFPASPISIFHRCIGGPFFATQTIFGLIVVRNYVGFFVSYWVMVNLAMLCPSNARLLPTWFLLSIYNLFQKLCLFFPFNLEQGNFIKQ